MMEEGRTQHLKDSKKRLEEWTKAFNLFEIKVSKIYIERERESKRDKKESEKEGKRERGGKREKREGGERGQKRERAKERESKRE